MGKHIKKRAFKRGHPQPKTHPWKTPFFFGMALTKTKIGKEMRDNYYAKR